MSSLPSSDGWAEANCKGAPTEWFFPEGTGNVVAPQAFELCRTCPVADSCYVHALHHEVYGMWAGFTQEQLERVRSRQRITVRVPSSVYQRLNGEIQPHGTDARWLMHYRDGEVPVRNYCPPCADARMQAERLRADKRTTERNRQTVEQKKAEDRAFSVLKSLRLAELEGAL